MVKVNSYQNLNFKLITTPQEALNALSLFTTEAVIHTDFISQMNIKPSTFLEESLNNYAEVISQDRLSLMVTDESGALIAA